MSANPTHQIWTTSKVQRLPAELRRRVTFYAPLIHSLDYLGVGEATFTRAAAATATYRDGAAHTVAANIPRFEYAGENALGLPISSSETLSFPKGNRLGSGTLIWFEAGVVKVSPLADLNPFDGGQWQGALDTHIRDILHVSGQVSDNELNQIVGIIADQPQAQISSPGWIMEEPEVIGATTRRLVRRADLSTLLISAGGVLLRRVGSSPGLMQYSISEEDVLTFGSTFQDLTEIRALYRRWGSSGPTFLIEDVAGTKDGANTAFTVSQAPTGGVILVVRQGGALEKVVSSAGLMQYEISGANLTLGQAPQSTDDLWALLMTSGSGFSVENLGGTKDGANKDFTISAPAVEGALLAFLQGASLTRVIRAPGTMEYVLDGTNLELGTAPLSSQGLWAFLRTS